jgi:ATP-dependent DNA helicase PIF1
VEKGDTVLAKRRQFPLRLAYAITSHRAQGMTLTCPIVASLDKRVFEFGMAYSILSRAKRPEQIILRAFRADCIRAHPAALAFETSHKD